MEPINQTLTAIEGITVGHATDAIARTGCTVILCPAGATAGVDVRGAAPGTRETEALRPGHLVQKAHAVLLTGWKCVRIEMLLAVSSSTLKNRTSVFLRAPFMYRLCLPPLFSIWGLVMPRFVPTDRWGIRRCLNATDEPVAMGVIGAGTGATVGKAPGVTPSTGGIGSACKYLDSGLICRRDCGCECTWKRCASRYW